jgi:hypothetical protein
MPNKSTKISYEGALAIAVEILLQRGEAEKQKIETESATLRCRVGLCERAAQGNALINHI